MMSPSTSFDASAPRILLRSASPSAAVRGAYRIVSDSTNTYSHKQHKKTSILSAPPIGNFLTAPSNSLLRKKNSASSAKDHMFQIRRSSKMYNITGDVYEDLMGNEDKGSETIIEDPWALEKLLEGDETSTPLMPTWKKYARIILPHIGLILLSMLYVVGGAFIFYQVERPNEIAVREENLALIEAQEVLMLNELWRVVNDNNTSFEEAELLTMEHVDNVSRLLFEAFDTHYISISHLRRNNEKSKDYNSWTMTTSIFFTTTLLTTIGYGNLVPITATGRMFCIFYALIGVPLILITVTDIGKFLSENIIRMYSYYALAKKKFHRKRHLMSAKSQHHSILNGAPGSAAFSASNTSGSSSESLSMDEEKCRMQVQLQELGLENFFSIPMTLIGAILLGYLTIGAILLAIWEKWGFFEGFYYSFITMTTIGFGDIVPIKQEFFFIDLIYIIVGLAITTMCIDLVGVEYIQKIHYFGRAISGARFALVNVGDKMVRVPDLIRYAHLLHQKYGQKKPTPQQKISLRGAYVPKDLARIRYIDFGSLASFESLTSLLSNLFWGRRSSHNSSVVSV